MPKVPVSPSLGLQPAQQARYSAQGTVPVQDQTPGTLGRMGQAFAQAGQDWGRYAAEVQRRADIAYTTERQTQAAEADLNDWSAYSQKQGKDAYDGFDSFRSTVQKRYDKLAESAENEQQRQWLKQHGQQRVIELTGRAMAHRDKEVSVWRIGTAKADGEQSISEYRVNGTPEALEGVVRSQQELASLTGVDGTAEALDKAHIGRVETLLRDPNRIGEAVRYWGENGGKVTNAEERDKWGRLVRGTFLQTQTVALGNSVVEEKPSTFADAGRVRPRTLDEQFAIVDELASKNVITGEESRAAKSTLLQMADDRDKVRASMNKALRNEADEWFRVHPRGAIESDPVMVEKFRAANMPIPERVRITDPEFDNFLQSMPAATVAQIQRMNEDQLDEFLATGVAGGQRYGGGLDKHRAERWKSFFQGDMTKAAREDAIERTALLLGISASPTVRAKMNKVARAEATESYGRFRAQVESQIETLRIKLKGDPSLMQIQEEILDPMMLEGNKVTNYAGINRTAPLVAFQIEGSMPFDNPATRDVDESLDWSNATDFGVEVKGVGTIMLREVPMEVRRKIRLKFAEENPGQQMTIAQEMQTFADNYKPKLEAAKVAQDQAAKDAAAAKPTATIERAGAPWWEGPNARQDAFRKAAERGQR